MIALKIDNPIIEQYFQDKNTIEKILEFIAINKISINNNTIDLNDKLELALNDIALLVTGRKKEKRARDFLNEL
jgi:hypothetical protein